MDVGAQNETNALGKVERSAVFLQFDFTIDRLAEGFRDLDRAAVEMDVRGTVRRIGQPAQTGGAGFIIAKVVDL